MTDLEDLIVKEASRQGFKPNEAVVRQASIDLAGAVLTQQGLIQLPGRGSISPADYVRSLHSQMPAAFSTLADDKPIQSTGHSGLTAAYITELAANRNRRVDASKFSGLTRQYIEENQGKKQ
jgi:hypothetical protein